MTPEQLADAMYKDLNATAVHYGCLPTGMKRWLAERIEKAIADALASQAAEIEQLKAIIADAVDSLGDMHIASDGCKFSDPSAEGCMACYLQEKISVALEPPAASTTPSPAADTAPTPRTTAASAAPPAPR